MIEVMLALVPFTVLDGVWFWHFYFYYPQHLQMMIMVMSKRSLVRTAKIDYSKIKGCIQIPIAKLSCNQWVTSGFFHTAALAATHCKPFVLSAWKRIISASCFVEWHKSLLHQEAIRRIISNTFVRAQIPQICQPLPLYLALYLHQYSLPNCSYRIPHIR